MGKTPPTLGEPQIPPGFCFGDGDQASHLLCKIGANQRKAMGKGMGTSWRMQGR